MARKKGLNKSKVGFSIDKDIQTIFDKYCNENMKNKSAIVNNLIRTFLEKEMMYETGSMDNR